MPESGCESLDCFDSCTLQLHAERNRLSARHRPVAAILHGGGVVFLMDKRTRLHVRVGFDDVVSMLVMNVKAFGIYRPDRHRQSLGCEAELLAHGFHASVHDSSAARDFCAKLSETAGIAQ